MESSPWAVQARPHPRPLLSPANSMVQASPSRTRVHSRSPQAALMPVRPNLPDDPVIPHNGFLAVEEAEEAFVHLLRKAGVDAKWTWDQTMHAIITDPLYKALDTLAEKKACWEKVRLHIS